MMMMNRRTTVLLRRLALIVALAVVVLTAAATAPADVTRSSSVLVASFAISAPSFAGPRSYATGYNPGSVAIGDLNGDGKPDLVTGGFSGAVSVLLNRGYGRFKAKVDYRTGAEPGEDANEVAVADLNGDGKLDLATSNGNEPGTVSVLLNRGDGRFKAKVDYRTGRYPQSLAIGDLNGDDRPDLAAANWGAYPDTVSVLLNRGDGSFKVKVDYATGAAPLPIAIGDLNGDGKLDLATANGDAHTVSVRLNGGDGSFVAKRDYATGRSPGSVAIGDLNGDGKPDLATANEAATDSVLLNRGDGSFRAKVDYPTGGEPSSVAIGDLNGDRKPDLATANYDFRAGTVSVLLNRGDGSFKVKVDYPTGTGPRSVAIGDLNGDRKPDLATADFVSDTVSVLANASGLCGVPNVRGKMLQTATRTVVRADCRVGKIRWDFSKTVKKGRVISQRPKPGTVQPKRGNVNLVVSRGRIALAG